MADLKLQLTLNKNGSVTAGWARIAGAVKYDASMRKAGASVMVYNVKNLTAASYTSEANLEANTQYRVTVIAYGSNSQILADAGATILIPSDFYNNTPLGVPQNVRATANDTSVTVAYNKVDRATGYDIQFDGTVYNTTGISKSFTGLKPKTSHTYAVRAKNSGKTGSYSARKSITTLGQVPSAPANIRKTSAETSATISWGTVSGATSYDIQFNGTTYRVTETSRTFTGLTAGKGYVFQVRANNAQGSGPYSGTMTVTTAPKPPATVTATSTDDRINLSWSACAGAVSYTVRFRGNEVQAASQTSCSFGNLEPKTSYSYQVCARSADGIGSYSPLKTIMTKAEGAQVPAVPTNIKKTATETSATVSWGAVSGAASYDIQFNGTTYRVTAASRTFTGLTAGKGYDFRIRANNAQGSSPYGGAMTVTTAPKPPATVTATSTDDTINLSWSACAGAVSYTVRFRGNEVQAASQTSCSFGNLEPKTSYTYQVCARSADGIGSFSPQKSIMTKAKAAAAPSGGRATTTEDSVELSWDAVPGATGYDVLFNGATYSVTGTTKRITGLSPNTAYTWQVRSRNADGISPYSASNTVRTTPAAPSGVSVSGNENSVTVSWSAVPGATSYDILFNGAVYNVAGTSRTFTGLNANTSYAYRIRVRNADGVSTYSVSKAVKTAPVPPSSPNASTTKNSATVRWNSVPGATSYDLLFNGTVYHVTGTSKTISGLNAGTVYTYQVRSNNADGSSSYGAVQRTTTAPNPPGVPVNVRASATKDSVTVSWSAVSGATGYDVSFHDAIYSVGGTSVTVKGLAPDTNYRYAVRARNSGGAGAYCATQSVRTLAAPPDTPENVRASAIGNIITVSWNASVGAAGYDVLFDGKAYAVNGAECSRIFAGLSYDTDYNYAVRARNAEGVSAYSPEGTVRTQIQPPDVPQDISATAETDSVTVSWSPSARAESYDLSFGGSDYHAEGTTRTITGLTPDTGYSYAVRANNAGGSSAYSEIRMIWTRSTIPEIPENIRAAATAHTVTLSWNGAPRAADYDVLFDGREYPISDNAIRFLKLDPNTDHTFRVRANNSYGSSGYSPERTIRTLLETPSGIHVDAGIDSLTISWDPVDGASVYDVSFNGKDYHVTDAFIECTGLKAETAYEFAIRARNDMVASEYTPVMRAYTRRPIPAVPANVSAHATLTTVTVTWDPVYGASSYDVRFDGQDYHKAADVKMAAYRSRRRSGPLKIFFDLKPDTVHTFCVRANNESGSSEFSELQEIETSIGNRNGLWDYGLNGIYPGGRIPYMGLDPVNAVNGAFLWSYTFLEDEGKDGLNFTLMYDSQRERRNGALGGKWSYSLDYTLTMDGKYAYFSTPYDEVIAFATDGEGGFRPADDAASGYTMTRKEEGTYCIRSQDGTAYTFGSGLILQKIEQNGLEACRFTAGEEGRIVRIEGRRGAVLELAYTGVHITRVTDALGHAVTLQYDGDSLSGAVNADGDGMRFTYDDAGLLLEITDFAGVRCLSNGYDEYGRVISQDTAGRGISFASYDEDNGVTTFTDGSGNETVYHYDRELHVTGVELAGRSIQNQYDGGGRLTGQTDALGRRTGMAYDECGRMNCVAYPDGTKEQVLYNERNYPVRIVNRDNTASSFEYDERNNVTAVHDERGNTGTYAYDGKDNLTSYVDKEGNEWSYSYDAADHLEQARDPEGNLYQYSHDALGRLVSYTSPAGRKTSYEYSASGRLLRIVDADGAVAFTYDRNGSRTGVTDRMGNRQRLEYNGLGQVSMATDFLGNIYTFEYDEKGNLTKETDPLGHSRSYAYDASGNRTSWTDCNGGTTQYTFDAANQLTEVRDAQGGLIQYAYDTMGQVTAVTDALKHTTGYSYDAAGRLTCITNALSDTVSYTYDEAGNLLTKTDEEGAVITYAYDKENRLASVTSGSGTTRFTYDKLGRLSAVQDTEGHSERAGYDGDGSLTEYTDKEGNRTAYSYDKAGRLIQETSPAGGKTSYQYDKNGRCTRITDAQGNVRRYGYDAGGRMTKQTDPLGNVTAYEYDARGMLKTVTDARGGRTAYEYDGNGNLTKETNPAGGEKTYAYDSLNRLISVTDEEGGIRSFAYDANGNRTAYTDANGNQWTYEYDALGRLTCVAGQDGGRLEYAYTKTGRLAEATDQEGAKTCYRYDALGRLTQMTDALGHGLSYAYDSLGRIISRTDANGNTTEYSYSPAGSLLSIKMPEGGTTSYTYDALGRVLTEKDPLGNITAYEYDVLGQVTSITDPAGDKVAFTYTANGQIASVTDANGGVTQYRYDACGNLSQAEDPLGNVTAYEYDAMNNQIKECLSADGRQTCATLYQYDKKGRLVREINPLSEEKVYTYDKEGNVSGILDGDGLKTEVRYDLNGLPSWMRYGDGKEAQFRYNKRGQLVRLTDWNGTTAFEYDAAGRLSKAEDHNGRPVGYGYDAAGNIARVTYPDGSAVDYAYDKDGRLSRVSDGAGGSTQYAYDAAGNVLSLTNPGGSAAYAYNRKGLPSEVRYRSGDGTHLEESLSYDPMGRITGVARQGSAPGLCGSAAYAYDPLGRLLSWQEGPVTEAYGYDALGNRKHKEVNGVRKVSYEYNALNQLITKAENGRQYSYGYDGRGNLTEERQGTRPVRQYLYDAADRLRLGKDLESGEETGYGYNALNMRISEVRKRRDREAMVGYRSHAAGAPKNPQPFTERETSYAVDFLSVTNNELMAYEEGTGTTRTAFGRGYERLWQRHKPDVSAQGAPGAEIATAGGGKAYFQPDLYGSPLFATDSQGNILRHARRGIWGSLEVPLEGDLNASGLEGNLRFTSYAYDGAVGKQYAHARMYSPGSGRMLGTDPVKRGLNGYPYCGNDPVDYVDPTGEIAGVALGGLIGGAVGGAFGFAGSAASQIMGGDKFSVRKALGSAANGAVIGAVRGAMAGSGIGAAGAFAADFGAGALGSALEQGISRGKVSFGRSMTGGLANAVSGAIYGTKALEGAGEAFFRGAAAGAVTSGINSLYNGLVEGRDGQGGVPGGYGWPGAYMGLVDPRSACGSPDPFRGTITFHKARGYRYSAPKGQGHGKGYGLADFGKDVVLGAVTGGIGSAVFYGAGKAVEALKGSVRGNKGGSQTTELVPYYPSNDGAVAGTKHNMYLMAGDKIDRYGNPFGKYFSPTGTPMEMRALPYNANLSKYTQYEVLKPFEVEASTITPAFGKIGLGTQYRSSVNADVLVKREIIKQIGGQ